MILGNSDLPKDRPLPEASSANHPPFSLEAADVAKRLGTDPLKGLGTSEAEGRLRRTGPNTITSAGSRPWWRIAFAQFNNIVVWLLAFAAFVAWLTDSPLEAVAILVVLIINGLIGFAIEWKAGRALEALRKKTTLSARVIRDGRTTEIDAEGLVPGDVISLTAGDSVPADARIFSESNFKTDESTLTGESLPVQKSSLAVEPGTLVADRRSMVFLGTSVVSGHGTAIVTATGMRTELGAVGKLLSESEAEQTPLEKRLARLGERLVYIVIVIAALVMATGYLRGDGFWLMLEVGISLAVAAVPEGLPAVTTLILALGVLRMARRNAIVKRLSAVETLGSTTVICSDKTGTLTQNRMSVRELFLSNGRSFEIGDAAAADEPLTDRLFRVAVICSEAAFGRGPDGSGSAIGDPTEVALLTAADSLGYVIADMRASGEIIAEAPFDSHLKRMISVWRTGDGESVSLIKGAPAVVLDACTHFADVDGGVRPLDPALDEEFRLKNREMANRALRVLAFAEQRLSGEPAEVPEKGYTFLGFTGMSDPLRPETLDAVNSARKAGIKVVMLTGDQMVTAGAIARELGLGDESDVSVVHASELEERSDEEVLTMVSEAGVFARVSPQDKFRIVETLQGAGEIVAVTGDGVNDAPAMKRAEIGIAMGLRGTDVAKEAADVVLTDDNFSTIVKAIEGGRTIYSNIIRFVHMMFSHNIGEVLMIFGALLLGLPLPLLPLQILWINLVTDVFPALALAVEPATPGMMNRPPRSPDSSLLSGDFVLMIGWQGVMIAAIALAAYGWALGEYGEGDRARTVAMLAIIGAQLGHFFNCRSRVRSVFSRFFSNPFIYGAAAMMILLQVIAIYVPQLALVLRLEEPSIEDWAVVGLTIVTPIVIVEIVKIFIRRSVSTKGGREIIARKAR